jgi:hypothetical protein
MHPDDPAPVATSLPGPGESSTDPALTTTARSKVLEEAGALLELPPTVKPGWKTTEFWLSKVAIILGALLASGLVADGSSTMRIAGMAAVVLSSFGYTISRGMAKSGAAIALVVGLAVLPSSSACGHVRDSAGAGAKAFIDCMTPAAKATIGELGPVFGSVVRNALDSSGKIDRSALTAVASPLKSDGPRCALNAAIAAILAPPAPAPGAPQSSPLEVDEADVAAAYADVRANLWGGVELK